MGLLQVLGLGKLFNQLAKQCVWVWTCLEDKGCLDKGMLLALFTILLPSLITNLLL